ncbi:hypothetical protein FNH22_19270 [Fulvivirga sp. M361]|uniref:hypothetical protein n=1 Tax=Fulvivirga sp. M361 TaxID=2594266 RepID=UPI00117B2F14|nr:hypothetical protein [Fulvivirga sp. M361]TRX54896.1 hypothetical protein FNH22_19270 [Fulvivirga sp. M361]
MYSVILQSPVQHEKEELNELESKIYRYKKVNFPVSITDMSESTRTQKYQAFQQLPTHQLDTTIKMNLTSVPAQAIVQTPICNKGIAMVIHKNSRLRKRGKLLDISLEYVCVQEDINMNWISDGKYLIEPIGDGVCSSGFHSIEWMFYNAGTPKLARVLYVCGER